METSVRQRTYKAGAALIFAVLAVLSLIWLAVDQFVDLPLTFSDRGYSAAVFPALAFGVLATFVSGFSWIDFPPDDRSRELRMTEVAMVIGVLVVLAAVIGLVLPLALNVDLKQN